MHKDALYRYKLVFYSSILLFCVIILLYKGVIMGFEEEKG